MNGLCCFKIVQIDRPEKPRIKVGLNAFKDGPDRKAFCNSNLSPVFNLRGNPFVGLFQNGNNLAGKKLKNPPQIQINAHLKDIDTI